MLPWVDGPATTACSGSSWGWSHSAGMGIGERGLGPLWRVTSDVPAISSTFNPVGMLAEILSWELLDLELLDMELQLVLATRLSVSPLPM